jgi:SOS-response transcriptional repressor LexA
MEADLRSRFAAVLKASGKTGAAVAREAGTTPETISRIKKGHMTHVRPQLLARIAKAIGTTSAHLLGDELRLSPEDEEELLRHRSWIDGKLPKIDARDEPNAILIASAVDTPVRSHHGADMIADRPQETLDVPNAFKRRDVLHVLRAIGDSMIGAGIVNHDTLYAIAAPKTRPIGKAVIGKVIACRLDGAIYVKRVVTEHDRILLLNENPGYRTIEVDQEADDFDIIGIVIGRTGAVD